MGDSVMSEATDAGSVALIARTHAIDEYLAALLAPRPARDDLIVLAAYYGEIARIPLMVSDPAIGELRLQWWRDALLAQDGTRTANPVADAFNALARRRGFDQAILLAPIEASAEELYAAPFPTKGDFENNVRRREGSNLALKAQVLGVASGSTRLEAAADILGRVRSLLRLPYFLALGRDPLPDASSDGAANGKDSLLRALSLQYEVQKRLAEFAGSAVVDRGVRAAILPVALARPYLRALERSGHDVLREIAEIAPLTRVSRLLLARLNGRF